MRKNKPLKKEQIPRASMPAAIEASLQDSTDDSRQGQVKSFTRKDKRKIMKAPV